MKTNRTKRLFTVLMIVLIITGTTIPASLAAKPNDPTIKISNAEDLQNYFADPAGRTAVLSNDITAPDEAAFVLHAGRNATLNLNGKTITGVKWMEVITIAGGNLTLRDSRGTGMITHNNTEGRGIFMRSGSLLMTGGTVCGNQHLDDYYRYLNDWDLNGGGVYVKRGTFTMTGGVISGNAAKAGGGVYVEKGKFIMSGGIITGNSADYGGGVFVYHGKGVTICGGEVTRNTARSGGGGVYCFKGGFGAESSAAAVYGNYLIGKTTATPNDFGTGEYHTRHTKIAFGIGAAVAAVVIIGTAWYFAPALLNPICHKIGYKILSITSFEKLFL